MSGNVTGTIPDIGYEPTAYLNAIPKQDYKHCVNELSLGKVIGPQLEVSPSDTVQFDSVKVEDCAIKTVIVKNTGDADLVIEMLNISGISPFRVSADSGITGSIRIQPGKEQTYTVSFCPNVSGEVLDSLQIRTNAGNELLLLFGSGRAVASDTEYRGTISLDTVTSHVGKHFRLAVRFNPPLEKRFGIRGYRATLRMDRQALYLWGAYSAIESALLPMYRGGDNVIIDVPNAGVPLATHGDTLLVLELEGLVTGLAENRVELVQFSFKGGNVGSVDLNNGSVHLEGCDIGRNALVQATASIATILPNPMNGTAAINYRATVGSVPLLRLLDMTGRERFTTMLPTGNGLPQQATVNISGIPDGVYLLQLRVGIDASTVPVVISH